MRIGLIQADTVWEDKATNYHKTDRLVAQAAEAGADVVALCEMFATGFTMAGERLAELVPGPTTGFLADLASRHHLHVIGTVIQMGEDGRPYNAAVALNRQGSITALYRKVHLFSYSSEDQHYAPGDRIVTFDVDGIPASVVICYDLRFPEPFRAAADRGAQLFFVPANWPERRVDAWNTLLPARAIENQAVVCGINRVGDDPAAHYSGSSGIYDHMGHAVARSQEQEAVILGDVDFEALAAWRAHFTALKDRRKEVYREWE